MNLLNCTFTCPVSQCSIRPFSFLKLVSFMTCSSLHASWAAMSGGTSASLICCIKNRCFSPPDKVPPSPITLLYPSGRAEIKSWRQAFFAVSPTLQCTRGNRQERKAPDVEKHGITQVDVVFEAHFLCYFSVCFSGCFQRQHFFFCLLRMRILSRHAIRPVVAIFLRQEAFRQCPFFMVLYKIHTRKRLNAFLYGFIFA